MHSCSWRWGITEAFVPLGAALVLERKIGLGSDCNPHFLGVSPIVYNEMYFGINMVGLGSKIVFGEGDLKSNSHDASTSGLFVPLVADVAKVP